MHKAKIVAIAAIGRNRELGKGNELLWRIPEDLRRFKEITAGHPIVLGRKTFESIVGYLGQPLPGRHNIVVTRNPAYHIDLRSRYGGEVGGVLSVEEAIARGREIDAEQVSIGGGAQIYEAALPYTDRLHLTLIDDAKEADSFFPAYEDVFTTVLRDEAREYEGVRYRWVDVERG